MLTPVHQAFNVSFFVKVDISDNCHLGDKQLSSMDASPYRQE